MMTISITWWLWVISGFALIGLELMIPTSFFIFFCGVGGVIVGIIYFALPGLTIGMQFLLWSILSIVLIALLRKKMNFNDALDGSDQDSLVGKSATASEEIGVGAVGRGELRGSTWSLKNVGEVKISAGAQCKVTAVDGLTLNVVSI
jgi:membrane protein implicated in regulation of membrane protease activity